MQFFLMYRYIEAGLAVQCRLVLENYNSAG